MIVVFMTSFLLGFLLISACFLFSACYIILGCVILICDGDLMYLIMEKGPFVRKHHIALKTITNPSEPMGSTMSRRLFKGNKGEAF